MERKRKEQKVKEINVNSCSTTFSFTNKVYRLPSSISFTPMNMVTNYFVPAAKAMQGLNSLGKM